MASAVALAAVTGVAAAVGVVTVDADASATQTGAAVAPKDERELDKTNRERDDSNAAQRVSRSASRPVLLATQRAAKHTGMPVSRQSVTGRVTETVAPAEPQEIAILMLAEYGWSDQYSCLDSLYVSESDWNPTATNPTSGAYGIPQSLPAEKMASAGPDWRTNPSTQLEWGLDYIRLSYGTPCSAWAFKQANNWY